VTTFTNRNLWSLAYFAFSHGVKCETFTEIDFRSKVMMQICYVFTVLGLWRFVNVLIEECKRYFVNVGYLRTSCCRTYGRQVI